MNHVKNKKSLAVIVSVIVVLCLAIGGTLAWLVDATGPVENTFTYGDIDLKLDETVTDEKGNPVDKDNDGTPDKTTEGNKYEMLPGEEYLKDPAVTVEKGNEKFWLFVKLTESGEAVVTKGDGTATSYDFDDFLTYGIADGWTPLQVGDHESVYFRLVDADTDNQGVTYDVLKDNKIAVKGEVTKEMLNGLDKNGQDVANANYPKLTVKSYGIQFSGFEPEAAQGQEPTDAQIAAAAGKAWGAIKGQLNEQ